MPICLSIRLSVCLFVHLSVSPFVCLPICLSVCLFVRLSVCPLSVKLGLQYDADDAHSKTRSRCQNADADAEYHLQ